MISAYSHPRRTYRGLFLFGFHCPTAAEPLHSCRPLGYTISGWSFCSSQLSYTNENCRHVTDMPTLGLASMSIHILSYLLSSLILVLYQNNNEITWHLYRIIIIVKVPFINPISQDFQVISFLLIRVLGIPVSE